jgi:hypothetical protein
MFLFVNKFKSNSEANCFFFLFIYVSIRAIEKEILFFFYFITKSF